jgi:peroxiredoxin Q/BCP
LSLIVIPDRPSPVRQFAGILPDISKLFLPNDVFSVESPPSVVVQKFASKVAASICELRNRDTRFDFALESTLVQRQSDFRKATKGRQMTSELQEGVKAPPFKLAADNGEKIALADFKGKKLVVFFYPRADTPGCTKESIAFSALKKDFTKADTAVVGISADPANAQGAFKKKHALKVPLLSDETKKTIEAYGAWGERSMYGRKFMGIVRTTVLIGADGKVARVWPKVKVDGHAEEVLEAANNL